MCGHHDFSSAASSLVVDTAFGVKLKAAFLFVWHNSEVRNGTVCFTLKRDHLRDGHIYVAQTLATSFHCSTVTSLRYAACPGLAVWGAWEHSFHHVLGEADEQDAVSSILQHYF